MQDLRPIYGPDRIDLALTIINDYVRDWAHVGGGHTVDLETEFVDWFGWARIEITESDGEQTFAGDMVDPATFTVETWTECVHLVIVESADVGSYANYAVVVEPSLSFAGPAPMRRVGVMPQMVVNVDTAGCGWLS